MRVSSRADTESARAHGECQVSEVAMGADTKRVREVGGLLERLQRRVALETRCDRGSSFGTELVVLKTAGVGFGGEWSAVSMGADTKANTLRRRRT